MEKRPWANVLVSAWRSLLVLQNFTFFENVTVTSWKICAKKKWKRFFTLFYHFFDKYCKCRSKYLQIQNSNRFNSKFTVTAVAQTFETAIWSRGAMPWTLVLHRWWCSEKQPNVSIFSQNMHKKCHNFTNCQVSTVFVIREQMILPGFPLSRFLITCNFSSGSLCQKMRQL